MIIWDELDKEQIINFPNGMKASIEYGYFNKDTEEFEPRPLLRIRYPYRRVRVFDIKGRIITELIEENPNILTPEDEEWVAEFNKWLVPDSKLIF